MDAVTATLVGGVAIILGQVASTAYLIGTMKQKTQALDDRMTRQNKWVADALKELDKGVKDSRERIIKVEAHQSKGRRKE